MEFLGYVAFRLSIWLQQLLSLASAPISNACVRFMHPFKYNNTNSPKITTDVLFILAPFYKIWLYIILFDKIRNMIKCKYVVKYFHKFIC